MNDALIARIQKLLSLAQSGNEHEAKAAADKANELLVKYNLDLQSVEDAKLDYGMQFSEYMPRFSPEAREILWILRKHFFVKPIIIKSYRNNTELRNAFHFGANIRQGVKIQFLGEKTNLQIAAYTFSFLITTYKNLFNEFRKETQVGVKARKSFYRGLAQGLDRQLTETRRKVEVARKELKQSESPNVPVTNMRGLVVIEDKGLEAYVKTIHPRLGNYGGARVDIDSNIREAGFEQGKNIRIHRGVTSTSKSGALIGGK